MLRALVGRGHRVGLACYAHGEPMVEEGYALLRTLAPPGYRRMRAGPDLVKPALDLALAALVAQSPAQLLHAHNHEGALVAALGARGRPIVYSAHTLMEEELPTYLSSRWAGPMRRLGGGLDWLVPQLCDQVMAISPRAAKELRRQGARGVELIEPGVSAADLAEVEPLRAGPGPWVVYAGNPDRYQDLPVLLEAMRKLPDVGLLLVGASGFEEHDLRGIARLHVVRSSNFGEIRAWIAGADVAALPRATCAGFPIKLLNYLGMGVPTVAARGSARELPGVVVVPDRRPAEMASALARLLEDPARAELGRHARQHVLERWTWERRVLGVEECYGRALEGRRGR
jgi:glycosyltransferase involved in cell wall biosynthesis